jgi:hypothetical protein
MCAISRHVQTFKKFPSLVEKMRPFLNGKDSAISGQAAEILGKINSPESFKVLWGRLLISNLPFDLGTYTRDDILFNNELCDVLDDLYESTAEMAVENLKSISRESEACKPGLRKRFLDEFIHAYGKETVGFILGNISISSRDLPIKVEALRCLRLLGDSAAKKTLTSVFENHHPIYAAIQQRRMQTLVASFDLASKGQ